MPQRGADTGGFVQLPLYNPTNWHSTLCSFGPVEFEKAQKAYIGVHGTGSSPIRRRFKAGLANFHERYSKVVDSWAFYDSSGMNPKILDWSNK